MSMAIDPKYKAAPREEVLDALRQFVELQRALLSALREQGDGQPLSVQLWTMPRRGTVAIRSREWTFTRHGAGVTFEEVGSKRTVNVPTHIDDPERFDLWCLVSYFGSLGPAGIRLLARANGRRRAPTGDILRVLLDAWRRSGDIHDVEGMLALTTRT